MLNTAMLEPTCGLYVHIPFCEKKCAYCDFNTYAGLQARFDETVEALCREMAHWRPVLAERMITSVFVGGGTPTVLNEAQLTQLWGAIQANFELAPGCEVTCEANPGTVDRAKFRLLRELGVNRLSLGVQSFQPDELAYLSRIHSVEDVLAAFAAARSAGFTNINLDFIFGLPEQSLTTWEATLSQALALTPEHFSLYSLIVEPNTPLHHWVESGQSPAPDDDVAAELYLYAMTRLAAAGYRHYEVSNWANTAADQPQRGETDNTCRHNLGYWRNQEYVGIGPGAHSHLRTMREDGTVVGRRWANRKPVPSYVRRIHAGESVEEFSEWIDAAVAMGESMMLGLRLVDEGVAFADFQARHGCELRTVFARQLAQLTQAGLLHVDEQRVWLTEQGLLWGNQVFAAFLPD